MRIVGFRYDQTGKVHDMVFYNDDDQKYINCSTTEDLNVFVNKDNKEIEKILEYLNCPEEVYYIQEKNLNDKIEDILSLRVYYNSEGHLSSVQDSEVIDLDGLDHIQVSPDLFKAIKNKPRRLDKANIDGRVYTLEDQSLFVTYDPVPIQALDLGTLVRNNATALAMTKVELMKANAITSMLIKEIASMKVQLMELTNANKETK